MLSLCVATMSSMHRHEGGGGLYLLRPSSNCHRRLHNDWLKSGMRSFFTDS